MMKIFALLFLAHLLADFVFQSDSLVNQKSENARGRVLINKSNLKHCLHLLVTSLVVLLVFGEVNVTTFFLALLVTFSHYFIDLLKLHLQKIIQKAETQKKRKKDLERIGLFLMDQAFHILLIYFITLGFKAVIGPGLIIPYILSLANQEIQLTLADKIIMVAIAGVCLTFVSGRLIGIFLAPFKVPLSEKSSRKELSDSVPSTQQINKPTGSGTNETQPGLVSEKQILGEDKTVRFGIYVGILERILIAIFMSLELYVGLGLLGTFKTIARFKQLEDKDFAEYYILGTLLSLLMGIIFGYLIQWIINYEVQVYWIF
jgi:hypothetical protein